MITMFALFSLVTSSKDYFEIVHKLMEYHPNLNQVTDYAEFGSVISFIVLSLKSFLVDFISFRWLQNIWSLPVIVPDIASAMISEISVLDGNYHNAFTFLEAPFAYGSENYSLYGLEKFLIGVVNSFFLVLPTSAAHIILIRRFVFQGVEGGYLAGIGIIAGNILWFASIIFGWRFFVIPWLSFDILRYVLGFVILMKFMWHASRDQRKFSNLSKSKIVLVNFLLAFTEQTSIYPFLTNISAGAESSILETFPVEHLGQFYFVHASYILGLFAGSLSLLHFSCWLWENPIARLYNLAKSKGLLYPNLYKDLNFLFLYLIMLCTISSIPYYGLDYTLTNPLGLVSDDRILYTPNKENPQIKQFPETSFLNGQASDLNARNTKGRHGRRERWKSRLVKYRGLDASLYDQGIYDLFTIEDLNYGFDKFWIRRKMRSKKPSFRIVLLKPLYKALKIQLIRPRLMTNEGARVELFRMIYDQFYHPNFHAYKKVSPSVTSSLTKSKRQLKYLDSEQGSLLDPRRLVPSSTTNEDQGLLKKELNKPDNKTAYPVGVSALRKFVRKINTRIKASEILLSNGTNQFKAPSLYTKKTSLTSTSSTKPENKVMESYALQGVRPDKKNSYNNLKMPIDDYSVGWQKFNNMLLEKRSFTKGKKLRFLEAYKPKLDKSFAYEKTAYLQKENQLNDLDIQQGSKQRKTLHSNKERKILRYKTILAQANQSSSSNPSNPLNQTISLPNHPDLRLDGKKVSEAKRKVIKNKNNPKPDGLLKDVNNQATLMLHPIKFYLQKEKAFKRKFKFYGANIYRKLSIENNAPHFRTMMKRAFYYYKPTLRWTTTFKQAKNTQGDRRIRKRSRNPLALFYQNNNSPANTNEKSKGTNESTKEELTYEAKMSLRSKAPDDYLNTKENSSGFVNNRKYQEATHSYSIVNKNASRIRREITKQVFLNWFYSPFNRVLLKLDVDSFIRRQPDSHFLTKKDEQGLHLKRFLLGEHYETLRWYTYMQHYRSMKTKIGGTKSFSSRVYNQQFQGTLKKIRHLFAITPSLFSEDPKQLLGQAQEGSDPSNLLSFFNKKKKSSFQDRPSILKFDQPLYNEYSNTQKNSIINDSVMHEELLLSLPKPVKDDFIAQSTLIVRDYLKTARPIRQGIINNLLKNKNYKEFTKFVFTGQKDRGTKATTNQHSFLNQEKLYLLTELATSNEPSISESVKPTFKENLSPNFGPNSNIEHDLWFSLLKNYKKAMYDKKFITKFVARRTTLRSNRQARKQMRVKKRLELLKTWLASNPAKAKLYEGINPINGSSFLTTGLRKAMKDGLLLFGTNQPFNKDKEVLTNYQNSDYLKENNSLSPLEGFKTILTELNQAKKINYGKRTLFDSTRQKLGKGFLKTKAISHNLINNIKTILNLILTPEQEEKTLTKTRTNWFKALTKKDSKWWNTKRNTLQKRSSTRKQNYIKYDDYQEVKKTTYLLSSRKESQPKANSNQILLPTEDPSNKELKVVKPQSKTKLSSALYADSRWLDIPSFAIIESQDAPPPPAPSMEAQEIAGAGLNKSEGLGDAKRRKSATEERVLVKGQNFSFYNEKFGNKKDPKKSIFQNFFNGLKQTFKRQNGIGGRDKRLGGRRQRSMVSQPNNNLDLPRQSHPSQMAIDNRLETIKKALLSYKSNSAKTKLFDLNTKQLHTSVRKKKRQKQFYSNEKSYIRKSRTINKEKGDQAGNQDLSFVTIQRARGLTKQIQRIRLSLKLQKWWHQHFLPTMQAMAETSLQLKDTSRLQEMLTSKNITSSQTIKQDLLNSKRLQIGNYDIKPLALPQALQRREYLNDSLNQQGASSLETLGQEKDLGTTKRGLVYTNSLPFYAGWDEAKRQFVVTNRLLTRREAGYSSSFMDSKNQIDFSNAPLQGMNAGTTLYCNVPFSTFDTDQLYAKGMDGFAPIGWRRFEFTHSIFKTNTLFKWLNLRTKIKTNTKNPNNFLSLINSSTKSSLPLLINKNDGLSLLTNRAKMLSFKKPLFKNYDTIKKAKSYARQLIKHDKRKKKLNDNKSTVPVLLMSGPLIYEVLPMNYINVFEKTNRFSKDRYLVSRLRRGTNKSKKTSGSNKGGSIVPRAIKEFTSFNSQTLIKGGLSSYDESNEQNNYDFTFRRRLKTRRKYHRKPNKLKGLEVRPRRHKFISETKNVNNSLNLNNLKNKSSIRQRPTKRRSKKKNIKRTNFKGLVQQKRRIPRLIVPIIPRYVPRNGGFVWPGDYLRLEKSESPRLALPFIQETQELKDKNKQKITRLLAKNKGIKSRLQDKFVQPRKYLLEKHNIKVIKKKLEKALTSR